MRELLNNILKSPKRDDYRAIYIDWLLENNQENEAEKIKLRQTGGSLTLNTLLKRKDLTGQCSVSRGFVDVINLPMSEFYGTEEECPNNEEAMLDPETGGWECCRACDHTGLIKTDSVARELFKSHPIEHVIISDLQPEYTSWHSRMIPWDIWVLMPKFSYTSTRRKYDSVHEALTDLNTGCLLYGYSLRGF